MRAGGWHYQNWVGKFTEPGVRQCWQISHLEGAGAGAGNTTWNATARRQTKREEGRGPRVTGNQTSDPEAPGSAGDPGSGGATEEAARASPRARWWPERGGAAPAAVGGGSPGRRPRDPRGRRGEGQRRRGWRGGQKGLRGPGWRTPHSPGW